MQLPDIVQPMADNHICELESFSDVFLPPSNDIPFSAVDLSSTIRVGLPPRIVSRQLLEQMNAHDFVGCVQNPTWRRGSSYGSASRAAAGIRNLRQTRKVCSSFSSLFEAANHCRFQIMFLLDFKLHLKYSFSTGRRLGLRCICCVEVFESNLV